MQSISKPICALWGVLGVYLVCGYLYVSPETSSLLGAPQERSSLVALTFIVLSCCLGLKLLGSLFYVADPLQATWDFLLSFAGQKTRKVEVNAFIDKYNELHNDDVKTVDDRNSSYATLVDAYYELATLFYEWGWGDCFHFAVRRKYETFKESIRRHEYYLAGRLGLNKGSKVLDCGCGIGGPYRNIAEFTGCDITGITLNDYQVKRANNINRSRGLADQVRSVQGDFMKLPFKENSFDGVYAIEATCHAPSRVGVYEQIYRVLKPGGIFACYEWCITDKYDPENEVHRSIKKNIEEGDGLPDMCGPSEIVKSLEKAGFEILEHRDVALDEDMSLTGGSCWYEYLLPSWNIFSQRFQFTGFGKAMTRAMLYVLETIHLAPAGTSKVQAMLQRGGEGCGLGGATGTFTPMYLAVVRKPAKKLHHHCRFQWQDQYPKLDSKTNLTLTIFTPL
eukprot:158916_1